MPTGLLGLVGNGFRCRLHAVHPANLAHPHWLLEPPSPQTARAPKNKNTFAAPQPGVRDQVLSGRDLCLPLSAAICRSQWWPSIRRHSCQRLPDGNAVAWDWEEYANLVRKLIQGIDGVHLASAVHVAPGEAANDITQEVWATAWHDAVVQRRRILEHQPEVIVIN